LIRVWVERYQSGAFDEDAAAADLVQQYEARIAASNGWSASRRWNWNF
jgi:transposase